MALYCHYVNIFINVIFILCVPDYISFLDPFEHLVLPTMCKPAERVIGIVMKVKIVCSLVF